MDDPVVDAATVTNGTIQVRIRLHRSGKIVVGCPKVAGRPWLCEELRLSGSLKIVVR